MPFSRASGRKVVEVAKQGVAPAVEADRAEPAQAAEVVGQQEDQVEVLARMAALFQEAAADKRQQSAALAELERLLGRLKVSEFPALADSPVVEEFLEMVGKARAADPNQPPGSVLGTGVAVRKKAWTWQDLNRQVAEGKMEVVEYTCPESITVVWNGLHYSFVADVPVRVPSVFRDVYMEARRARKFSEQHAAFLMRKAEAAHPDMLIPEAIAARAAGSDGHYLPGGGLITGAAAGGGSQAAEEGAGGEAA